MMHKALAFACLFLASSAFVAAQEEVPLVPKPPTASQGKMLVVDAVHTAQLLTKVEEKIANINDQFTVVQSSIAAHNAQYGGVQCTYTEKNPSACDGWVAEGQELNAEIASLAQEKEAQKFKRAELRGYLSMRMAKLRMMAVLEGLTEWEQEVVACSRLKKDADRGCLISAWERHP